MLINEKYLDFNTIDYNLHVTTLVHEVLHTLFFSPILYTFFPTNSKGQSFFSFDFTSWPQIRGDSILQVARAHFGCPTLSGGNPSLRPLFPAECRLARTCPQR